MNRSFSLRSSLLRFSLLRSIAFFFSLAMIVFIVSCATLRVDVDVYKGPLTNDPDVQLQQIAMMVIGAKPMLENMRDDLQDWEKGGPEQARTGWKKDNPSTYTLLNVPDAIQDRSKFTNEIARQLNEILTLYEDLPESNDDIVQNLQVIINESKLPAPKPAAPTPKPDDSALKSLLPLRRSLLLLYAFPLLR